VGNWPISKNFSRSTSSAYARRWTIRSLAWLPSCAVLVSVFLPSCGPRVRQASLSHPTLRVQGETEQTHDDLTIAVEPITWENVSRFPEVYRTFTLETPRGQGQARGPIVPLPAFRVTVTNHTGHVIRFTQSIIRLSVDLSRQYQPFSTTGEILAWAEGVNANTIATYASFGTQLSSAIGQLRVFSRNVELLNGDSLAYYLVFQLPVETSDPADPTAGYRSLLESLQRFRLRIAEVPIEADEAGQVVGRSAAGFQRCGQQGASEHAQQRPQTGHAEPRALQARDHGFGKFEVRQPDSVLDRDIPEEKVQELWNLTRGQRRIVANCDAGFFRTSGEGVDGADRSNDFCRRRYSVDNGFRHLHGLLAGDVAGDAFEGLGGITMDRTAAPAIHTRASTPAFMNPVFSNQTMAYPSDPAVNA